MRKPATRSLSSRRERAAHCFLPLKGEDRGGVAGRVVSVEGCNWSSGARPGSGLPGPDDTRILDGIGQESETRGYERPHIR